MEQHKKKLYSDVLFSKAEDIEKRGDPKSVPSDMVALFDAVNEMTRAFCTKPLERDQYWIIVELQKFSKRLDRLEEKYEAKKPDNTFVPPIKRGPGRPRKTVEPTPAGVT